MTNPAVSFTSPLMSFVGVRTGNMNAMKKFAEEVLGYTKKHDADGFAVYKTPIGQHLEFFELDYEEKKNDFTTGPVPGFEVSDFDAALDWLKNSDYEMLGEPQRAPRGTRWVHFRGPDGNVYEFVYHPGLHK